MSKISNYNLYQIYTNNTTSNSEATKTDGKLEAVKVGSVKLNGELHSLVIDENGDMWDFDETTNVWTKRDLSSTDESVSGVSTSATASSVASDYNKSFDLGDIEVAGAIIQNKDSTTVNTYSTDKGSTISNYKITNTTYNNVAVIDNFDSTEDVTDTNTKKSVDIGVAHGDLTSALIKSSSSKSSGTTKTVAYDLGSDGKTYYENILKYLNEIEATNSDKNSLNDIKEINLSIGSNDESLSKLGLSNNGITTSNLEQNRATIMNAISASGDSIIVDVINKIDELANKGVKVYIAAGNDANDTIYDKADTTTTIYNSAKTIASGWSQYDKDGNGYIDSSDMYQIYASLDKDNSGVITGREMGCFNLLTLANTSSSDNVFVVGSEASSTDGLYGSANNPNRINNVADYSNKNDLVDEYTDGDVNIKYVGEVSKNGKKMYTYDIDGDGTADLTTETTAITDLANVFAGGHLSDIYFDYGTSFAAPNKLKLDA